MNDYSPQFPPCVSGGGFRKPLDHPDIESIGKQADHLYRATTLNDDDRAMLLKIYSELKKADRFLARRLRNQPVWITQLRPRFWNDWLVENADRIEAACGFVWRVLEYINRLEIRYAKAVDDRDPGEDV